MTETTAAVDRMASHLTTPFARGTDRLELSLAGGGTSSSAEIAEYDFAEHRAQFGLEPKPRYVLRTLRSVPVDTSVTVRFDSRAEESATVALVVPAGTLPGTSFAIPLPGPDATMRLRGIDVSPGIRAGDGTTADHWRITALLGDLAALLWALSGEKDTIAARLAEIRGQRTLPRASVGSLDLIGSDLGIPRFPPMPYAFEPGTVALYHLDEPGEATQAADAMALYRSGHGHPGTSTGAGTGVRFGAPGRFATGAQFTGPAEIRVAHHADFEVADSDSLTVEWFVRPDAGGDDNGAVVSKLAGAAGSPGWAFSMGTFGRGLERNVRWTLADEQRTTSLYADVSLDTGRFQHLAGVLDRAAGQARLYVDGQLRASRPIDLLGELTSQAPLLIGEAGQGGRAAFRGTLSELRISRAARAGFHPVLGESDESYRRRLTAFRRWTLPTPANLQVALNEVAGAVAGVAEPFVVEDAETHAVLGTRTLVVRPDWLAPGEAVDALGDRNSNEGTASGVSGDDDGFDPVLLADASDPRIVFAGERRMRLGTRQALRSLLDLLDTLEPEPGKLIVLAGFDPEAGGLRAVGRALVLQHETVPAGRLAALAHRAGFSWARHEADSAAVHVSMASTQTFELVTGKDSEALGFDVLVGKSIEVRIEPPPPAGVEFRWSLVHHEHGRAELATARTGSTCRLVTNQPGRLVVRVEARHAGRTTSASRTIRIGLLSLPPGGTIAADGQLGAPQSVAGRPDDAPFRLSLLVAVRNPALPYVPGANRMLPELAERLDQWLELIADAGLVGQLRLVSAWQAGHPGLDGVGRALVLEPTNANAPMDRLAALAHAAGLDHVAVTATAIRVTHRAGDGLRLRGPVDPVDGTDRGGDELVEDEHVSFRVEPRAKPAQVALAGSTLAVACAGTSTVTMLNPNTGEVLGAVPTEAPPVGVATSPDGTTVFAVSSIEPAVTIVSAGTVTGVVRLPEDTRPLGLAHHPTARELVVLGDRTLVLVDPVAAAVTSVLPLPQPATAFALDPDGIWAWVAFEDRMVRAVRLNAVSVGSPFELPGIASDIAVDATRVYVTAPDEGMFCVLVKGDRVGVHQDAGAAPYAVAVDEQRQLVYVADRAGRQVSVRSLSGKSVQPPRWWPLPGLATDLLVARGRLYFSTVTADEPAFDGIDAVGVLEPALEQPAPVFWPLGTGHGERLRWTAQAAAGAEVGLSNVSSPVVRLSARRAGPVLLTARYATPGEAPFTFRVGLHSRLVELEAAGEPVVITKQQYDLVMNVLTELCPLGVEIDTSVIRAHVLELRAGLAEAFPAYTYPTFRRRPPAIPTLKDH